MPRTHQPVLDVEKAKAIWRKYQLEHDVTPLIGLTVGINPKTEELWFGTSALSAYDQQSNTRGISEPLYYLEVGQKYYAKSVGKRIT